MGMVFAGGTHSSRRITRGKAETMPAPDMESCCALCVFGEGC